MNVEMTLLCKCLTTFIALVRFLTRVYAPMLLKLGRRTFYELWTLATILVHPFTLALLLPIDDHVAPLGRIFSARHTNVHVFWVWFWCPCECDRGG